MVHVLLSYSKDMLHLFPAPRANTRHERASERIFGSTNTDAHLDGLTMFSILRISSPTFSVTGTAQSPSRSEAEELPTSMGDFESVHCGSFARAFCDRICRCFQSWAGERSWRWSSAAAIPLKCAHHVERGVLNALNETLGYTGCPPGPWSTRCGENLD
jgi:hypothetical protein